MSRLKKTNGTGKRKEIDRIQFEMNSELRKELEEIKDAVGMRTMREFLNNSVTSFRWMVRHVQNGDTIAAISKDGRIHELAMPCLDLARRTSPPLKAVAAASAGLNCDTLRESDDEDLRAVATR